MASKSADAVASFGVNVQDDTASGVQSSTASLERLRVKLKQDESALASVNKALKNLNRGEVVDIATAKQLTAQKAKLQARIAGVTGDLVKAGGVTGASSRSTNAAKNAWQRMGAALQSSEGPLGSVFSKVSSLASKVGGAGLAGGVALAVAALVALVVAAGAGAIALGKFALSAADAYRSEGLFLAALTKIPSWWGLAADKSDVLQRSVTRLGDKYGLTRTQLIGLTTELETAGYRGSRMQNALEANAIALAAFNGDAGLAKRALGSLTWQFGMLGEGSKAALDAVKARFGEIATRQALGVSKQMARLRQNVAILFSGVRIEGFLKGLNSVLSLFSQSTASGRILKGIIESIFNPLFGSAEQGFPRVKRFLKDVLYAVLVLQGYWLDLQLAVAGFNQKLIELGQNPWGARLLTVLDFIKGSAWETAKSVGLMLLPFGNVIAAVSTLRSAWARFAHGGWADLFFGAGANIARGIADGIASGAKWVWDAITELGSSALTKFEEILGIHSPSRAFFGSSIHIPGGAALGIRAGTPKVHAAIREMAVLPSMQPGQFAASPFGSAAGANGFGGGALPPITINVNGAESPKATADAVYEKLMLALRGGLTGMGGR